MAYSFEASRAALPSYTDTLSQSYPRRQPEHLYGSAQPQRQRRQVPSEIHPALRSAAEQVVAVVAAGTSQSSAAGSTSTMESHPQPPPQPPSRHMPGVRLATAGNLPLLVSDDVVSGTKRDGWMSPVRRFFCLLVTFDVIFTVILWIITVIVTGRDVKEALKQQVLQYTIYSSMFDCVIYKEIIFFIGQMAAGCRFVISILFYAILDINHWWPVALTTSGTTAFTLAKVFEYQWTKFGPMTFDVTLVLLSFVLAWSEMWFLDVRVLPLELRASELMEEFEHDERASLLGNHRHPVHSSGLLGRYVEAGSLWGESVANFYSPLESPEDSGDEIEEETLVRIPRRFKRKAPLNDKEQEYRQLGEHALKTSWQTLNAGDWKLEKEREETGDVVHSRVFKRKKVFKLTGIVDIPPKLLLEELFFQIESVPKWNPTLTECRIVQSIDSHTDVSYQVSAEAAGGVISTRDFVNVRHWQRVYNESGEKVYLSAGMSVKHSAMPPQPKRIRGENGPNCFAIHPGPGGNPNRTLFQWLLDTDLKGWIPQYVIDGALSGAQLDYIAHIRRYAEHLRRSGRVADFLAQEEAQAYASLNSTATLQAMAKA